MKNNKIIIFLLCGFTLANCQRPSEKQYLTKDDVIETVMYNNDPEGWFPPFSDYYLFSSPNRKGELSWSDSYHLQNAYNFRDTIWRYLRYPDFVKSFFQGKRLSEYGSGIDNVFILNDTIKQIYEDNEFEIFMNHYAIKNEERNEYEINRNLSENSLLTILYYAFLNDYFGYYHDIIGHYYVERVPISSLESDNVAPFDVATQKNEG